jgi:hypothetical protein
MQRIKGKKEFGVFLLLFPGINSYGNDTLYL